MPRRVKSDRLLDSPFGWQAAGPAHKCFQNSYAHILRACPRGSGCTRTFKSRVNFLELLRAGHTDYVLNDAAYEYMRKHALPAPLIASL